MLNKRTGFVLTALSAIIGVVTVLGSHVMRAQDSQRVSLTMERNDTVYKLSSGEVATASSNTLAIRSDGSFAERRMRQTPAGAPYEIRSIVDVPGKETTVIDTLSHSTTTRKLDSGYLAKIANPPSQCTMDSPKQASVRLGYQVFKSSTTLPAAPGEINSVESWIAPSLNCFPLLETHYLTKNGGTPQRTFAREITAVVIGSPDPSLFIVPSGYAEVAPSQLYGQHLGLLGKKETCTNCMIDRDKNWDDRYYASQNK